MILSGVDKLFKHLSLTGIVKTRVGIKPINQISSSNYFNDIIIKRVTNVNFSQIVAPPDFLKDKFTIIGKNISEWPHYALIKYLDCNMALDDCPYIKRVQSGTLDFRKRMKLSEEFVKKNYQKKISAMEKNEIFSIKIFHTYDNIYTVADGKHSLATALYFNYKNIKFELIQNVVFDTYFRWIFMKIKNDNDFTKHNEFFRRICENRKNEFDKIRKR